MDINKLPPDILVNRVISNLGEYTPCMLIGSGLISEFKQQYHGNIVDLSKLEYVRGFLSLYSGMGSGLLSVIVIEGIEYLSSVGQNSLLKFIEESEIPLIMLCKSESVSPIILSRTKFVFKTHKPLIQDNVSISLALDCVDENKSRAKEHGEIYGEAEETRYYAEHCPTAYYLKQIAGNKYSRHNARIIKIITGS